MLILYIAPCVEERSTFLQKNTPHFPLVYNSSHFISCLRVAGFPGHWVAGWVTKCDSCHHLLLEITVLEIDLTIDSYLTAFLE